MKVLRVASCQFPVQAEIERNREYILQQMQEAAELRADLAHFSECALSGYAGVDIPHIEAIDRYCPAEGGRPRSATHRALAAGRGHERPQGRRRAAQNLRALWTKPCATAA